MKTKFLAAFLAVCMVFSLMPAAALAAEGDPTLTVQAGKVSDGSAEIMSIHTSPLMF